MGEERGTKHGQLSDIVKGFLSIVHEATKTRKETKLASFTQTKLKQKRGWGLQIKLLFHHGQHSWVTGKDHCREEGKSGFRVGVTEEAARKGGDWRQEEFEGHFLGLGQNRGPFWDRPLSVSSADCQILKLA